MKFDDQDMTTLKKATETVGEAGLSRHVRHSGINYPRSNFGNETIEGTGKLVAEMSKSLPAGCVPMNR